MDLFFYMIGAVFTITNPLGTVPIFASLTSDYSPKEKFQTAAKTAINVLVILVISFFIGKYILVFFGISIDSLRIAGGFIIVSSGFALLTGRDTKHKGMDRSRVKEDIVEREAISLTPLAMPMTAGPGSISLLIGIQQEYTENVQILTIVAALICVSVATLLILASSQYISKFFGASGINAISRIVGFLVIAIGIEFISASTIKVFSQIFNP